MREFMADDAVVAAAERSEREWVGGGAIEGEEDITIGLEELPHEVAGAACVFVLAVGRHMALVRQKDTKLKKCLYQPNIYERTNTQALLSQRFM